jgi:hypothetical protein
LRDRPHAAVGKRRRTSQAFLRQADFRHYLGSGSALFC